MGGPIGRFERSKQVVSYLGLNPQQYSSGGRQRLGKNFMKITGAGVSQSDYRTNRVPGLLPVCRRFGMYRPIYAHKSVYRD